MEVDLVLTDGTVVTASVPSGASTGRHEAVELRDGDASRYAGLGVLGAVRAISEEIAPAIVGKRVDQATIDATLIELDGTREKGRLGANALLAVSLAVARAEAAVEGVALWRHFARDAAVTLPLPMVNIISGGLHAGRQLDFQDILVVPRSAETYTEALEMVVAVHRSTGEVLRERGLTTLRADEGGYGPELGSHEAALSLVDSAVERAGFALGDDIVYALDVAATHFADADGHSYQLRSESLQLDGDALGRYIEDLAARHPIVSVEDPFGEDDWPAWRSFVARVGERLQVVGDDLFTTNVDRLKRGIEEQSANAVLVKMNQIGTITETLQFVDLAKDAGMRTVISARSGETEDCAVADLAVGTDGGQIKIGSVTGSERLAKYNQLLRIEQDLGDDAVLAAWAPPSIPPLQSARS